MNHPPTHPSHPDSLHHTVSDILHRWGLSRSECDALLSGGDRRSRRRARKAGDSCVLTETQRMERIQHIIAIDRTVSQTFPQSPLLADLWITTPNPMLGDMTPLQVILEHGIEGMISIRRMLDGNGCWGGI
ncbi:MAG: MbcA/ParS/Xre antitoxin family protein [Gammaproteobacteria bacterium]|nr:MbcA/ParS/Xre antitoxin family protein [Gammaproteobacteria bacterium]